ncbi:MAG TPA: dienelactone hydrolase family protein [Steroidobacteraceae bacterium]|nr:dienelactone hydrolase family protein [Steroidobacteraceae bacterium]
MQRKTVNDFHPEVLRLFDKYVHGFILRREFLARAASYLAVGVTAEAVLDALTPKFAEAQQIKNDDVRIKTRFVEFDSPKGYGKVRAYLAMPAHIDGKLPVILVVHENRGLNPHIEDITRRLAVDNFIALAPDMLFSLGGYPDDEDRARELFQKLDQEKCRQDFIAAVHFLEHLHEGNGRVGVVGFCYGGGVVNFLATQISGLNAAVPFYGMAPDLDNVARIKAPLLIHYAEHDERINAAWPAYESALKAAHVNYQAYVYPGTQHGFNNDTTPRYDEAAAKLAWTRTVQFFNQQLR